MEEASVLITNLIKKHPKSNCFDIQFLENSTVKAAKVKKGSSTLVLEFKVLDDWRNTQKFLHGGVIMSLIDTVTSLTTLLLDTRPSVSIDITTSFISALLSEKTFEVKAKCYKIGKLMAFTKAQISTNGRLLATGMHTKAFVTPIRDPKI